MTDEEHADALNLASLIRSGHELHRGAQMQLRFLADALWDKRNWIRPKDTIHLKPSDGEVRIKG